MNEIEIGTKLFIAIIVIVGASVFKKILEVAS